MNSILRWIAVAFFSPLAAANICGSDFQNFNPTTSGIDFVTVHSSETLKPCIINMGLFFNYAVNNFTYSQTFDPNYPKGQSRKDKVLGADLSAGMGLTDRWDFGVNLPFVVDQWVDGGNYAFKHNGATEIKANTKYHLFNYKDTGFAAIVSANHNLTRNNPFTGPNPGLTWNYELAVDTKVAAKWAVAVNFGYRDRHPDSPVPGVPFVPLDDQWIFSTAGSYLIPDYDTKLILELYGSRAAQKVDADTDRNLNNLEALFGVKHDFSENIALHFGAAKGIDSSMGGAEWRVYAGLNWALGPVCETSVFESFKRSDGGPEVYTVDLHLLFERNSDQITPSRLTAFDTAYRRIAGKGFQRLSIEGHTDSVGSAEYNQDLSQRRANFVRQYLIKHHGVAPSKIEAKGFGESKPIADNGNYQGRQKNRRVEFKLWR